MVRFWRIAGKLVGLYLLSEYSFHVLNLLAGYLHIGAVALIFAIGTLWMSTNSEKSRALESRVNGHTAAIGSINSGTLSNVNGGTLTFTGGNGYLEVGQLQSLQNNSSFLSGLTGTGAPGSPAAAPSGYTQSWGQNITGVLNTIIAYIGQSGIW